MPPYAYSLCIVGIIIYSHKHVVYIPPVAVLVASGLFIVIKVSKLSQHVKFDCHSSMPHHYNTSALFDQRLVGLSLPFKKNVFHFAMASYTELTGQSQPLSKQCRCIVVMWVGGFGGLMQRSLTCKVHEPVNAAS